MHALHTPFRLVPHRAMAVVLILALPHSAAAVEDPFAGFHALKDEQLEQLRGGFENNQGLQFSFAIERAVVINGDLVTSTRLVLNDLSPLLSGGVPSAEITNSVRSIVQNGLGNAVSPAPTGQPATTAVAPATPVPGTTQATVSASSSAAVPPGASTPATVSASTPSAAAVSSSPSTSATPALVAPAPNAPAPAAIAAVPSTASSPSAPTSAPSSQTQAQAPNETASLFIQRNAGGQTIVIPNASAIVTAVQNSVNNQIIQTRTTIDAMLNSLSALRANTLANSIRQQSLDSVRRQ